MHGRRRRSHAVAWLAAAAAFLVLGGAAATVLLVRSGDDDGEPAAADSPPPEALPARRADQVTLDVDPVAGFVMTGRGSDAGRQFLTARDLVREAGTGGAYAGEVSAYEPGSFDAAPLQGGQVVTVKGHDAWYVPDYSFPPLSEQDPPHRGPAIGWPDPSGVWLLVYAGPDRETARDDLIRLADAVRLSPPIDLRIPFRVGQVPDGLAVTYVRSDEVSDSRGGVVGLSDPRRKASAAAVYTGAPYGVTLAISATVPDADWRAERADLTGRETVDGHPAWYSEGRSMLSPEGNGSTLIVETGPCVVRLRTADRTKITRAELTRVVHDMAIGDCGDPDTWITPLA